MIEALSEEESREHERDTWNGMTPGRIVTLQNNDTSQAGSAIVKSKGDQEVELIFLNKENVERILAGHECKTVTVGRQDAHFNGVEDPHEFKRVPRPVWGSDLEQLRPPRNQE